MKKIKINLKKIHFIPKTLEPGILYVSEEFGTMAHICPCGCGEKVITPLNMWTLKISDNKPTLSPSIGNFQTCGSHYFIKDGNIVWAN